MIYKNVLVPYDKSSHATHALETAIKLVSDDPEAKLTVLYAVDPTDEEDITFTVAARMAGVPAGNLNEENVRASKVAQIEELVAPIVKDAPNEVTVKVVTGKAHHAILNYAYDRECDLIVMGCRGLNAVLGMMGSVSYAVLRSAECPVFIVK
ncbi:MAG: universal stress protein [Eggerthellales bacterium]|nr:universal stress protein [Eggerthellales bacterium]